MFTQDYIVSLYHQCGSIKETARIFRLSEQTIRRILITNGEYSNETSEAVCGLREKGLSVQEISDLLHIAPSTVFGNLPYRRGSYAIGPKTRNAKKIKAWRTRRAAQKEDAV